MGKHRHTKDNVGIVYLFTNKIYEEHSLYKYGKTIKPFERKRIQTNSSPFPFYNKIIIFSPKYKEIEKYLEKTFKEKGLHLKAGGGKEWIKGNFTDILNEYIQCVFKFENTKICYGGKMYHLVKNQIKERKLINCRLDFLGIFDNDTIQCIVDGKTFSVLDNKIMVDGQLMTPTKYMNFYHNRGGKTNEHNGWQYFTFKGRLIYDMWQSLLNLK